MEMILGLLSKIDVASVAAAAITFVLGLAVIKPKLSKAVAVVGELADLLSDIKRSLEDGKVSKEEALEIVKEAEDVIACFKKK